MSTRRPAAIQPPDAASTHDRMPARVGSKASSPTNFSPSRSLLFAPRQARDPRRAARGRRDTGSVLVYRLRSASLEFLTARRHAVHGGAEHVQLERLAMYLAGERRADFDSGRWSAMCAEVSRPEARVGPVSDLRRGLNERRPRTVAISVFDLFSVGIGPSSSHTVGPMRGANIFANSVAAAGLIDATVRLRCELFGSLGATGKGHGSDRAVLMGLEGELPEAIDPATIAKRVAALRETRSLRVLGEHPIAFDEPSDLVFHRRASLPHHPNGMRFAAFDRGGAILRERVYYSVGGGFVVDEEAAGADRIRIDDTTLAHPFGSGDELLARCHETGLGISSLMMANEEAWRDRDAIRDGLLEIWKVMQQCVDSGCRAEGILPGGLKVRRRAAAFKRRLRGQPDDGSGMAAMDWVNLYALAVNEENADGGRVVTAPTNGAAGIVPAVLHYYRDFCRGFDDDGVVRFLLAAGAVGILYKENASISGAEVGCQGEVGSACSMAAAGLAEVLGGTPAQVENAAEIAMEHNLGLTCDPVAGLVQVPCIERNAIAAVKAINAARMALRGDGLHYVSLDKVIKTMRETGADMKTKYKETSRGGLAVNVIEC
jgi:L-serine dehydratase